MEITVRVDRGVTVVALEGELTARTAPETQQRILEQIQPGGKLILDMGRVLFLTSAGVRMLLLVNRTDAGKQGRVVLVGLSEDIKKTLRITGLLDAFRYQDSIEAGIAALDN